VAAIRDRAKQRLEVADVLLVATTTSLAGPGFPGGSIIPG
jgi:hypothetical protein